MDEHLDIAQIEKYLLHQMNAGDEAAFESRLKTDAALKRSTEEMQLLITGVQEEVLQGKLKEFHTTIPKAKRTSTPVRTWISLAAAIIIAASAIWWFMARSSKHEELFVTYFQPDPGLPSVMGVSDNYSFDRAMVDYKTGNYTAAIATWDSLLVKQPSGDTLNYFLGASWLALKKADKAQPYFEKVAMLPETVFANEAYWYLGLTHLKNGNKEKAIAFIGLCTHPKKEALLSELKK